MLTQTPNPRLSYIMKKFTTNCWLRNRYWASLKLLVLAGFLFGTSLNAQDEFEDEDIFELSPFVVDTSSDVGYLANNTLSGSRLNASLKDTPAIVSVFTQELIDDLAANDIGDILEYESSAQFDQFEATGATNSNTWDELNAQTKFRVRGFSAATQRDFFGWVSPNDNYMVERIDSSHGPNGVLFGVGSVGGILNSTTKRARLDSELLKLNLQVGSNELNRQTIDVNRVLIDGKLAIRLNALHHESETWRYHEFSDSNRAHLALVYKPFENTTIHSFIEGGEKIWNAARPWGPGDNIRAWVESGSPMVSYKGNGQPNIVNLKNTIPGNSLNFFENGINKRNANARFTLIDNAGQGYFMRHEAFTTTFTGPNHPDSPIPNYAGTKLYDNPELFGQFAIPHEVNFSGPGNIREFDFWSTATFIEQSIGDHLNIQVAYFHERQEGSATSSRNVPIYADPNPLYGDGSGQPYNNGVVNPYAGMYYFDTNWVRRVEKWRQDAIRVTAAYDIAPVDHIDAKWAKWAGEHQFALMYEKKVRDQFRMVGNEALDYSTVAQYGGSKGFNTGSAEHAKNRVWRRQYVNWGDWESFHAPDWRNYSEIYDPITGDTYGTTFDIPGNRNGADDLETTDTIMFGWQGKFLDGRLVTTFGYREDDVEIKDPLWERDNVANFGVEDVDGDGVLNEWVPNYDKTDIVDIRAIMRTSGLVYHVNEQISLFANQSDGSGIPSFNFRVLPDGSIPPGVSGESIDYGIKVDLFDGKLYAVLSAYESEEFNNFIWQTAGFNAGDSSNNTRILNILRETTDASGAALITQDEYDNRRVDFNGSLMDGKTEGYELSIVANPTPNWNLTFKYSHSEKVQEGLFTDIEAWLVDQKVFWQDALDKVGAQFDDESVIVNGVEQSLLSDDGRTIYDLFGSGESNMIRISSDKEFGFGERDHKVNFFTKYSFREGRMKGFSLGGGVRYQSPNQMERVILFDDKNSNYSINPGEMTLDSDGNAQFGEIYEGREIFLIDLMMAYRTKVKLFGKEPNLRIQLNVKNLFDRNGIYPTRNINSTYLSGVDGYYTQYSFQAPRSFRFTVGLDF